MRVSKTIMVAIMAMMMAGCYNTRPEAVPSCRNVSSYYGGYGYGLGSERIGSRDWVINRVLFSSEVGLPVRAVAAFYADGEPRGPFEKSISLGLWASDTYDVTFRVTAWDLSEGYQSRSLQRRAVDVDLRVFGPEMGAFGRPYQLRLVAIKYRGNPDTDWAICPES